MTWKAIPGFDGWYEANSDGRIRSVPREMLVTKKNGQVYTVRFESKELKPVRTKTNRYGLVFLWKQGVYKALPPHLAIMLTFAGPTPEGMEVCHKDNNPQNPAFGNLRFDTPKGNNADKKKHGTHLKGESISWHKLTEDDVRAIKAARGVIPQKVLATKYNVGQGHISRIQLSKQWRHLS